MTIRTARSPSAACYFEFDSYSVKDDYQALLQQHAQYLKSHPDRHVLIQGNTDERGTSEYNLALGRSVLKRCVVRCRCLV